MGAAGSGDVVGVGLGQATEVVVPSESAESDRAPVLVDRLHHVTGRASLPGLPGGGAGPQPPAPPARSRRRGKRTIRQPRAELGAGVVGTGAGAVSASATVR